MEDAGVLEPLAVNHVYVVKCKDGYAKFLVTAIDLTGDGWPITVQYYYIADGVVAFDN